MENKSDTMKCRIKLDVGDAVKDGFSRPTYTKRWSLKNSAPICLQMFIHILRCLVDILYFQSHLDIKSFMFKMELSF